MHHSTSRKRLGVGSRIGQVTPPSFAKLARAIGPCVYFIRTDDDLIKIGYTANLASRRSAYGSSWDRVLAVKPGTYEDEQRLHRDLSEHRARGAEYYHLTPAVLERVNELRQSMGLSSIENDL